MQHRLPPSMVQDGNESDTEDHQIQASDPAPGTDTQVDETLLSARVLWNIHRIGRPVISPDGKQVVAPVTWYSLEDDKTHTDLWLFTTDGTEERRLTTGGSIDDQPVFSPDGASLAFVRRKDIDDVSQICLLPMDRPGEAQGLTDVPTGARAPRWVGNHIYFISTIWPEKTWEEMKEALERREKSRMSARTWSALPFNSWDKWLEEEREAHLFRIPAVGGHIEQITSPTGWELPRPDQSTDTYDIAPDESCAAFVADSKRDGVDPQWDIFLVEPGNAAARNITGENDAPDTNPLFSSDGRMVAYTRQYISGFYGDRRRLVLYDREDGSQRTLAPDWDRSAEGLVWLPDGSGLFGTIDDAGTRRAYFISSDGTDPRPVTGETDFDFIDVAKSGAVVARNHSFSYPPRLLVLNTESGAGSRIDSFNDKVLADVQLGTYESVSYAGSEGHDIQMWIHYPPGFDDSRKYPLFLLIHGGPHNGITNGFNFRWNAQTFASWGYVTAWHNFHGSSGFGQDFADSINPDWVTHPCEDTIRAADWLAGKPWIDEERMVAGGGSYGGYLASILLGKPHPFRALVIHAPVYNMYSQLAADFAVHANRFGDYWTHDIYQQISAHYFAEEFNTPAVIIHGQQDCRVPVGQAFELFRTLQHRGIDSRLIYYPDENHWILKPNNSIYWYDQIRVWIETYAPPGPVEAG